MLSYIRVRCTQKFLCTTILYYALMSHTLTYEYADIAISRRTQNFVYHMYESIPSITQIFLKFCAFSCVHVCSRVFSLVCHKMFKNVCVPYGTVPV